MEDRELLLELVDLVEQTAPQLWEIALRQVSIYAGHYVLVALFFCLIIYILRGVPVDNDERDVKLLIQGIILVLCTFALFMLYEFAARLINPQYYAIEILVNLISGG